MCAAHPQALQSQTGALLDLNIGAFQTLRVVNHRLQTQRPDKHYLEYDFNPLKMSGSETQESVGEEATVSSRFKSYNVCGEMM